MNKEVSAYNDKQTHPEKEICNKIFETLSQLLPDAENKIWHGHPVWFLEGNPIIGYSKLKAGIRLMFWSGASFQETNLKMGTGKFKDAFILYTQINQIDVEDLTRWVEKERQIQWDYKNIFKRKGQLVRLK